MRLAILICAAGLGLAAAPQAAADGGSLGALRGGQGATAPGLHVGYVALPVRGGTLVERVHRPGGRVDAWTTLRGAYGVAPAGFEGETTGLAADGFRLVLEEISGNVPPARTRLAVMDSGPLRLLYRISLPGSYAVDAISPDGRWLYLIHYTSHGSLLRYEVRAYDVAQRRLLRKPVVDPREPGEAMRGTPVTRVTSADGRWAYTLYTRQTGPAFVHALDTDGRTARCIDLPGLDQGDPTAMRLSLGDGGRTLRAGPLRVDTHTFTVTRAAARRHPRPAGAPAKDTGGGVPVWLTAAVALAVLGALAGIAGVRRRRASYAG